MNIIVVDDEVSATKLLNKLITNVINDATINCFNDAYEALDFITNNPCDVAFLDIEMPEIKGIELAKKISSINQNINIIFTTGYDQYTLDALKMHASGYILKPAMQEDVKKELDNLRYKIVGDKHIFAHTLGNFDLFFDDKIINFKRSAAKEMMAYLIDRNGASVTRKELAKILFPNEEYNRSKQVYMSQIIASLMETLNNEGIEDLLIKDYNSYRLNMDKIVLDNKNIKDESEYMAQYAWGHKKED